MEELLRKLAELEARNAGLSSRIGELEQYERLPDVPDWAQGAVDKAVAQGLIDTPQGGSFDFYRFLVILDRKGLLG